MSTPQPRYNAMRSNTLRSKRLQTKLEQQSSNTHPSNTFLIKWFAYFIACVASFFTLCVFTPKPRITMAARTTPTPTPTAQPPLIAEPSTAQVTVTQEGTSLQSLPTMETVHNVFMLTESDEDFVLLDNINYSVLGKRSKFGRLSTTIKSCNRHIVKLFKNKKIHC